MSTRERADVELHGPRCPYCHDAVQASQAKVACDGCMAWQHRECWEAHGACAACGAGAVPPPPTRTARPQPAPPEVCPVPKCERPRGPRGLCPEHFVERWQVPYQIRGKRVGGWMMLGIGLANVLLFGGFLVWDLLGGPPLAGLGMTFILLGGALALWGFLLLRQARRLEEAS